MNNVVRPIFNENFVKKKRLMSLVNSARDSLQSIEMRFSMKKESVKRKRTTFHQYPHQYPNNGY